MTRTHPNVQTQSNGFVQLSVWGLKSRSGMHSRSAWDAHGAVCPRFVVDKRRSLCAPVSANHIKSHTECSGSPVVPGQELLFSPANLSVDARIPQSITDLVSSRNPGPRVSLSANLNLIDRRSVVSCGVSRCPHCPAVPDHSVLRVRRGFVRASCGTPVHDGVCASRNPGHRHPASPLRVLRGVGQR